MPTAPPLILFDQACSGSVLDFDRSQKSLRFKMCHARLFNLGGSGSLFCKLVLLLCYRDLSAWQPFWVQLAESYLRKGEKKGQI